MTTLSLELLSAYDSGAAIATPPSAQDPQFDMNAAYAVEADFTRLRMAAARKVTGLKVGYANKAMWRALKLETLVWAQMYDDTVHYANGTRAELALRLTALRKSSRRSSSNCDTRLRAQGWTLRRYPTTSSGWR